MNVDLRVGDFPEPEFALLQREVFAGLEQQSEQLAKVLADEAAKRASTRVVSERASCFRIGAYLNGRLVGWTEGWVERQCHFYMAHSGFAKEVRRQGVYSKLVERVVQHCGEIGCTTIDSRHITTNNPVLIAKLGLGFHITGFTYSEVYGPLVHLTCLLGEARRNLYLARSAPLRPADQ